MNEFLFYNPQTPEPRTWFGVAKSAYWLDPADPAGSALKYAKTIDQESMPVTEEMYNKWLAGVNDNALLLGMSEYLDP